jgi:signal transduction histidine kinase
MKKKVVILLILVQILLLFIFQNIYFLFKEMEGINVSDLNAKTEFWGNIKQMRKTFSVLSILVGIFLLASGIYLGVLYKKSKDEMKVKGISPLQNYLEELRDTEITLKDMIEKQQENVLRKEELNKSIVDNINAAIIFVNQHGRIDTFNVNAEKLFAQSYANAINNTLENILKPFPELIGCIGVNQGEKKSLEVHSSERTFWLDLIPMKKTGVLIILKDITEERRREEIERKNKNFVMLGEMTAFLTHEVRNSLGAIYGYTKSIGSEISKIGKEGLGHKVNKVNQEIELLSCMMESFLGFSKPVHVERSEKINLNDLIRKIGRENKLKIDIENQDVFFHSDPVLINSVFSNLFINAKEARANRIEIIFRNEPNLEIIFRDNGQGLKPDISEKIWYPLFTTKEKGTGMGLALVKKIMHSLGGDIQLVESTPRGTTFKIMFLK